jgi:hypothetical protein
MTLLWYATRGTKKQEVSVVLCAECSGKVAGKRIEEQRTRDVEREQLQLPFTVWKVKRRGGRSGGCQCGYLSTFAEDARWCRSEFCNSSDTRPPRVHCLGTVHHLTMPTFFSHSCRDFCGARGSCVRGHHLDAATARTCPSRSSLAQTYRA